MPATKKATKKRSTLPVVTQEVREQLVIILRAWGAIAPIATRELKRLNAGEAD